jgi:carboxymethylenebutenolidase
MCDDFTAQEEESALAASGLNRREFGAVGALAGMVALLATMPANAAAKPIGERKVMIPTADGMADALFFNPKKGKHPGIILWPDIAGIRDAFKVMARRLAESGYVVLLVNQYYRSAPAPHLATISEWRTPAGQAKLAPMLPLLTPEAITRDAKAYVAFLDSSKQVDTRRGIGSNGYCQGGPFTVRTAAAVPGRVKAAASFHGGGLVTDKPDSPHKLLASTTASYLIAVARNDDARAPADKDTFKAAAVAAGRPAEVEVYAADHGWCALDAPVYDKAEAERAWARLLALYAKL